MDILGIIKWCLVVAAVIAALGIAAQAIVLGVGALQPGVEYAKTAYQAGEVPRVLELLSSNMGTSSPETQVAFVPLLKGIVAVIVSPWLLWVAYKLLNGVLKG